MRFLSRSSTLFLPLFLAAPAGAGEPGSVALETNRALGLRDSEVTSVLATGAPGESLSVVLDLAGQAQLLELQPTSVRAEGFRVLAQGHDGTWSEVEPGPARTYRGVLPGDPGSRVAASLLDDGLHARFQLSDGREFWLQPVPEHVAGAAVSQHVLYETEDVLEVNRPCGVDALAVRRPAPRPYGGGGPSTEDAAAAAIAELACDADYEYFLDYGSSTAVTDRIESVINAINLQYEAEVDITHTITTVLVRSSASQPYTSTDAVTLLNQFRSEWNANQGGIQRDVAQLFTGKEINGGTIGIAWLGVVCNSSYGYGVVQSDFNGNFSCAADLSAHELGHNWDADHCSCTSNTMNPYITCANTFHPTFTIPEIVSFRDAIGCLETGGGGTPTSIHVDSIVLSTAKVSRGNKMGRATVTIVDDLGNPVSGAVVTGTFSGDFSGTDSATTNGSGVAVLQANGTVKGKVSFGFCVDSVSGPLPYAPGNNVETCDNQ